MIDAKQTALLESLGLKGPLSGAYSDAWRPTRGEACASLDPTTGKTIASVPAPSDADYDAVMAAATKRFEEWRMRPAPRRGELVRRLGEVLRANKEALGELISLEVGKIRSEGLGEVQEMIDICDFAVGLSRQLHGLVIASERARHRMFEQWHPLGPVGVVTAFNFPMAVWAWNAALSAVCGDVVVWKPSPRTPLCALAVQRLCATVMAEHDAQGLFTLLVDFARAGERLCEDRRVPLVSFTGSIAVGRKVAVSVAARLGRTILELGGNNAVIVMDDADLAQAVPAIVFGAFGTSGQRCTSTRRVFAHSKIAKTLEGRLVAAAKTIRIGDPLEAGTLMGPLVGKPSVEKYRAAVRTAVEQGGVILHGGKVLERDGFFVEPTIVRCPDPSRFPIAAEETFAPILYVFESASLDDAIAAQNAVTQGLSSAIFTEGLRSSERFLSAMGSDCGIAAVNLGTSGAEIGGAFGGEKDTGGGRESGSDAWKGYMRRQTCTVNWGGEVVLAQGVQFPAG
jgi:aldehyde dehydrogenase (NAD+)